MRRSVRAVCMADTGLNFSPWSASCWDAAAGGAGLVVDFGADCDFRPVMRLLLIGRDDADEEAALVWEDWLRMLGDFLSPCCDVLDAVFVVWTSLVHADDVVLGLE